MMPKRTIVPTTEHLAVEIRRRLNAAWSEAFGAEGPSLTRLQWKRRNGTFSKSHETRQSCCENNDPEARRRKRNDRRPYARHPGRHRREPRSRRSVAGLPQRYEKALKFLTSGYETDIAKIVNGGAIHGDVDEMVIVKDIEFFSLCEHHLLPFFGKIHVGYLPADKVSAEQDSSHRRRVRPPPSGAGGGRHARQAADVLMTSDLRGIDSHGVCGCTAISRCSSWAASIPGPRSGSSASCPARRRLTATMGWGWSSAPGRTGSPSRRPKRSARDGSA